MSLEVFEATAVDLARTAGVRAIEAFQTSVALEFKGKKQDNPVTALDRDTETFLRQELRRAFPDHGLLGEEHADDIASDAEYVWVLDPIDGTANFASGLPLWGISIGLLRHGAPVAGCIWVPIGPTLGPGAFHARLAMHAELSLARLRHPGVVVAPRQGRTLPLGRHAAPVTRAWWEHAARWSRTVVGSAIAAGIALVAVIRLTPKEMSRTAGDVASVTDVEQTRAAFELAVIGRDRASQSDAALMPSAADLLIPVGTGGASR